MSLTFTNLLTHIIFSTKDRNPIITPQVESRLNAYLGGIICELNGCPLTIHGTAESAAPETGLGSLFRPFPQLTLWARGLLPRKRGCPTGL